ncbi:MAG: hypothetical protein Kow0059_13720 [Candidatus Sumerlaeia bacterium]
MAAGGADRLEGCEAASCIGARRRRGFIAPERPAPPYRSIQASAATGIHTVTGIIRAPGA